MISADDLELVRRESALPGIRTVLDEEALEAALRDRLPDAGLSGLRATYARWKPGQSAVVGYEAHVRGSRLPIYARAHRRRSFERMARRLRCRTESPGPLGPRAVILEHVAVSVRAFTDDRDIAALPVITDQADRRAVLSEVAPRYSSLWEAKLRPLRYWPERRITCSLRLAGIDCAALKSYAKWGYTQAARAAGLATGGPPRLPRPIGRSDRHQLLAFEWLPGRLLSELLPVGALDLGLVAETAGALAQLHALPTAGLQPDDPAMLAGLLARRAEWVAILRPDLAARAARAASRLGAALVEDPPGTVLVHGDFSPKQVLVEGGAVAIIDLDDAAIGDPEVDLGAFLAALEVRTLDGSLERGRAQEASEALCAGYESQGRRVDRSRLAGRVAANLLGRVAGEFRNRRRGWHSGLEPLVARVEEIVGRGLD